MLVREYNHHDEPLITQQLILLSESAWLMTRARLPPGEVLQKAYGVLDKFKISRTFFVKTDQEGCAVAASDLNAANGITSISTIPESLGTSQKKDEKEWSKDTVAIELELDEAKSAPKPVQVAEVILLKASEAETAKEKEPVRTKSKEEAPIPVEKSAEA